MIRVITLMLIVFASNTYAEDRTWKENSFRSLALLTLAADWRQTRWMTKNYDQGWSETNDILGDYPTTKEVDRYFASLALIHYFSNRYMHHDYRWLVNTMVIATHGKAAYRNYTIGVKFDFNY